MDSPSKWPVMWKTLSYHDIIMLMIPPTDSLYQECSTDQRRHSSTDIHCSNIDYRAYLQIFLHYWLRTQFTHTFSRIVIFDYQCFFKQFYDVMELIALNECICCNNYWNMIHLVDTHCWMEMTESIARNSKCYDYFRLLWSFISRFFGAILVLISIVIS